MNNSYQQLWAKKSEGFGKFSWLPLSVHLDDTMNIATLLWEHWLSRRQRNFILSSMRETDGKGGADVQNLIGGTGDSVDDDVARNLVRFLAATHDIGKATPVFQVQRGYGNSRDLDAELLEKLECVGYKGVSEFVPESPGKTHHSLAGEVILKRYGVRSDIGSIIGAHHGKPVEDMSAFCYQESTFTANYFQNSCQGDKTALLWESSQRKIFEWALKASGFKEVEELPRISLPGQVVLSGLLIMADWIASNDKYFPLIPLDESGVEDKEGRIRTGWKEWSKSYAWEPNPETENFSATEIFKKRFGFAPRDFQKEIHEILKDADEPGIAVIEAPMGGGKTEVALACAELMASRVGCNGVFFGLPTQATSNGIFPRICSWLKSISEESGEALHLRLAHGKAALNPQFAGLARGINLDDKENGTVFVNQWFAGRKKTALDDFIVGTVDNFLMLALKQKHLALRHLGFGGKVVVIDEVHAYDAYMGQYLKQAVRWMGAYGVPVVILSATLPVETREALIVEYLRGRGMKKKEITAHERNTKIFNSMEYPLLTYTDGKNIRQFDDFEKGVSKKILIKRLHDKHLYEKIEGLISDGGVVGIIVNTVRRAQEIARNCSERFGESLVDLYHSSFIDTHRMEKESALIRQIGKGANRPHRKIIVGTQVIEQSLDIDFDVLISDLCPVDLLIQRVGRLHRHEINRPVIHNAPILYVMGINDKFILDKSLNSEWILNSDKNFNTMDECDFNKGSSAVYGDYLLIRTQYFLKPELILPDDISSLVQDVYGKKEPEFEEEKLKDAYIQERKKHKKRIAEKKEKSKFYRIGNPKLDIKEDNSLIGWLNNYNRNDNEETAVAQVRDIEETIEVIALKKRGEGYGSFLGQQDFSDKLQDDEVAREIAKQTIRLPQRVTAFRVDRIINALESYNNEKLAGWRENQWLQGSLGIIFNEENRFEFSEENGFEFDEKTGTDLMGKSLKYDEQYGLIIEVEKCKSETGDE